MTVTLKYEFGRCRSDGDCHHYVVPEKLVAEFDNLLEEIENTTYGHMTGQYDVARTRLVDQFNQKFGEYRRDDIYSLQVVL